MPNPRGYTMRDILDVEDELSLLDFRCEETGIVLWPLVRTTFFRMILSDLLYQQPIMSAPGRSIASRQGLSTLARSLWHNSQHGSRWPSDICLMPTALGHIARDGRVFNRLADHFALCLPERTLVWEDQYNWQWPFPRRFERVLLHSPATVYGALLGHALVRRRHRQSAQALVDRVSARAEARLQWVIGPERRGRLVGMLARKIPQMPPMYRYYREALQRQRTRLLIKEDGSYGPSALLMAAARSLGVVTAEYQHGAISAGHDAYNVAAAMAGSADYLRTMPDHFLGYGSWWNEQIDMPPNKIAVGNPHRSEVLAEREHCASGPGVKTDILVLGDGIETAMYLGLVRSLLPLARRLGLRLLFRPHPLERSRVSAEGGDGFAIDTHPDIYTSFESAYAVISEISTGLFEAVGLAQRVLLWETEKARFNFPKHLFEGFADVEQLGSILAAEPCRPMSAADVARTWASDWRANYQSFIAGILPATQDIHS